MIIFIEWMAGDGICNIDGRKGRYQTSSLDMLVKESPLNTVGNEFSGIIGNDSLRQAASISEKKKLLRQRHSLALSRKK